MKAPKWPAPPPWYHLRVTSRRLNMDTATELGIAPFRPDEKGECRCSRAPAFDHAAGLNRLSELHVRESDWDGSDICCTGQLVGWRLGVLRACPELMISQRLRRILEASGIKGYTLEVTRLH